MPCRRDRRNPGAKGLKKDRVYRSPAKGCFMIHRTNEYDVFLGASSGTLFSSGCVTHLYTWFFELLFTPGVVKGFQLSFILRW
jgi:hypothetical protein